MFPLREGKHWNGNIYLGSLSSIPVNESCNNLVFLEDWDYEYTAIHAAENIGTFSFDSTATVEQNGSTNLTELNTSTEIYAKNVGLVYREFYHLTTQNICPTCPWEENAECGYIVRQTVVEFVR